MNKRRAVRKQERLTQRQADYWRKMVAKQAESGQSVSAFCQANQLVASKFFAWQKEVQQSQKSSLSETRQTANHRRTTKSTDLPRSREPDDHATSASKLRSGRTTSAVTPSPQETAASMLVAREQRFRLTKSSGVDLDVGWEVDGEVQKLDVELVDISQGGARLRSKTLVPQGTSLMVTLVPKGYSKFLSARALVRWTTLAPKGEHWLGCSLEPRLPQALLDHLAANGYLERRNDPRQDVAIKVTASWELDPAKFEATILNISQGGLCMLIAQDGHIGDRIRLTLPGEHQRPVYVLTTVCWQLAAEDGFIIGCSFCQTSGYEKLMHLASVQSAEAAAKSQGRHTK